MNPRPPPALPTLGAALDWARRRLAASESGPLEAAVLLSFLMGISRTDILTHPEEKFPPRLWHSFRSLVVRCAADEPLAYLVGEKEFFGLPMIVTPAVLIPRPETEILVEVALQLLPGIRARAVHSARPLRAVDVGTGSGCIAVALAVRVVDLRMVATDISREALAVAARNVARHGVGDRISLLQADLLSPLHGPFDLICANLPYIPTGTLNTLPVGKFEPPLALDGGPDGLRYIERLLAQAPSVLAPSGVMLMEIETTHNQAALNLAQRFFPDAEFSIRKDFAGKDRLLVIQRREAE